MKIMEDTIRESLYEVQFSATNCTEGYYWEVEISKPSMKDGHDIPDSRIPERADRIMMQLQF